MIHSSSLKPAMLTEALPEYVQIRFVNKHKARLAAPQQAECLILTNLSRPHLTFISHLMRARHPPSRQPPVYTCRIQAYDISHSRPGCCGGYCRAELFLYCTIVVAPRAPLALLSSSHTRNFPPQTWTPTPTPSSRPSLTCLPH